jgi:hypothetical protein
LIWVESFSNSTQIKWLSQTELSRVEPYKNKAKSQNLNWILQFSLLQTSSYGWENLPCMFLSCWALKLKFEITVLGLSWVELSQTWDKFEFRTFKTSLGFAKQARVCICSNLNSNLACLQFEMQMFAGQYQGWYM